MKKFVVFFFFLMCTIYTSLAQYAHIKRVILFTIDGLNWQAPEKLNMPVFNGLVKQGTYIRESYVIVPHHPTVGEYSSFNSCSFPNPVLHEGTVFLKPENKMIQELFSPKQQTAFVVNTPAYKSVGRGFSTVIMDETLSDEQVVDYAISILKTQNPVFMRVHLQTPGQRGYEISQCAPNSPYFRNIFKENSPYIKAIENADKLLGQFVSFLRKSGLWNETVLIVTSDHGQSKIGWHPLFDEDSWKTPLVFVGASIAKGRELSYFEQTDLAPTIAGLLGKETPNRNGGEGNFVNAILEGHSVSEYHPSKQLVTINRQIKKYNILRAKLILKSEDNGYFSNVVALLENESVGEPFYHQDRIVDWYKAGTIKHLIDVNETVLERMAEILKENK